jgi:hypothetical protein
LLFFGFLRTLFFKIDELREIQAICAAKKSNFEQNPERNYGAKFLIFDSRTRGKRRSRRKDETFQSREQKGEPNGFRRFADFKV